MIFFPFIVNSTESKSSGGNESNEVRGSSGVLGGVRGGSMMEI